MKQVDPSLLEGFPTGSPIVVCYGGGVDSTAMLIALRRAGVRPDLITFADTGGEKPETYQYVRGIDQYLKAWGFPTVTWCKKTTTDRVDYDDLEGNCLSNETLPSLAFGRKSCSLKWKQAPQDAVIKGVSTGPNKRPPHPLWLRARALGVKPVKLIGYDAGKADLRRSNHLRDQDEHFHYRYPLQGLGWTRETCVKVIIEEGLPVPLKSACFYCPASKPWELFWLAGHHPNLFKRALRMERIAMTGKHARLDVKVWTKTVAKKGFFPKELSTVGLGRSFSWNLWALQNSIIDSNGEFIADTRWCRQQVRRYRNRDNALDGRSCKNGPRQKNDILRRETIAA